LIKKIVLFGSESTGKTTLAQQLAIFYKTVWVPEFAREYLENERINVHYSDVIPIAKGQLIAEDALIERANKFLICDTNILETKVYSDVYFGASPEWLLEEILKREYDLYLLTDIDVEWSPDPLRDKPHQRKEIHNFFKNELLNRKLPFAEISGLEEERLKSAIYSIEKFFDGKK